MPQVSTRAGWALTAARIAMGAFFLNEAATQLRKGWIGGDGLAKMLRSALDDNSLLPPYRYFLEHVVLEHDGFFTVIVMIGEIAVGTTLVLGLATRLTTLSALFMNVNFLLMNSITFGGLIDAVFIAMEILLIMYAARQTLSVDGVLGRRGGWRRGGSAASWERAARRAEIEAHPAAQQDERADHDVPQIVARDGDQCSVPRA